MSVERQPQSNESLSPATSAELEALAKAEARDNSQNSAEHDQAQQIEQARTAIEQQPEPQPPAAEAQPKSTPSMTRLDKALAYNQTLRSVQKQLRPLSRSFSKVIHNPVIEKTSELAGQTIMRPSVTLGATLTALLVGGSTFLLAKRYGFPLQGSELILLLPAGAIIGFAMELLFRMARRRK
jgi:hypothetical protein